jgi:hypothetical protein
MRGIILQFLVVVALFFLVSCGEGSEAMHFGGEEYQPYTQIALTPSPQTNSPVPSIEEETSMPEPEPALPTVTTVDIQVHWATDEFLSQFDRYHEFIEIDSTNSRSAVSATRERFGFEQDTAQRIAFTTDAPIRQFSFVEADALLREWVSYGNEWSEVFLNFNALYWLDDFMPKTPVVIAWDDWMTAPHRWISVLHDEEIFFSVRRDGDEISLTQLNDLPGVLYTESGDRAEWAFNRYIWERPPRTHVIGILEHPDLTVESVAVYMNSWTLAHWYLWYTYGTWGDLHEIEDAHELILQKHADSIVDESERSATIRKILSAADATVLHYSFQNLNAIEELTPRHSGHPAHADPFFQILISYADGTYEWIRTGEGGAFFFRLMGTFTSHGDEAFAAGVSEDIYSLLLSYFINHP